eukprot:5919251-Prymnesium_polylepis.1
MSTCPFGSTSFATAAGVTTTQSGCLFPYSLGAPQPRKYMLGARTAGSAPGAIDGSRATTLQPFCWCTSASNEQSSEMP